MCQSYKCQTVLCLPFTVARLRPHYSVEKRSITGERVYVQYISQKQIPFAEGADENEFCACDTVTCMISEAYDQVEGQSRLSWRALWHSSQHC